MRFARSQLIVVALLLFVCVPVSRASGEQPSRTRIPPEFARAQEHERLAEYQEAAVLYEKYADSARAKKRRNDGEFALQAAWNAGRLFEIAGDNDEATRAYSIYIGLSKKVSNRLRPNSLPASPAEAEWKICEILKSAGQPLKLAQAIQRYTVRYGATLPRWQIIAAKNEELLALEQATKLAGEPRRLDELARSTQTTAEWIEDSYARELTDGDRARSTSKAAIAHAEFFRAEPEFQKFKLLRFHNGDMKSMRTAFNEIKGAREALDEKYKRIAEYGADEWTLASMVRTAMLPKTIADALREMPGPSGFKDIDCCVCFYRPTLDDAADSMESPLVRQFEAAIAFAFEHGIYNEWTLAAEQALAELRPDVPAEAHELPLASNEILLRPNRN